MESLSHTMPPAVSRCNDEYDLGSNNVPFSQTYANADLDIVSHTSKSPQFGVNDEELAVAFEEFGVTNSSYGALGNDTANSALPAAPPLPSYMEPTISSALPPYMAGEAERVRNSYRTGTCWTIKDLPQEMKVGVISAARKKKVADNLLQGRDKVFKPASSRRLHMFNDHHYMSSEYDKEKLMKKTQIDEKKTELDTLARKPFVVTSRIRSKTEDIFYDPEWKFPSMGPGGGKIRLEEMTRSNSSVYEEKFVDEPGLVSNIRVGHGVKVQEWCKLIHAKLSKDWSDYRFRIKFTKSNELLIQFLKPMENGQYPILAKRSASAPQPSETESPTTRDADNGQSSKPNSASSTQRRQQQQLNVIFPPPNNMLNKYMHHQAVHGTISRYGFKRRGDRWNMYEVEYAYLANDADNKNYTSSSSRRTGLQTNATEDNFVGDGTEMQQIQRQEGSSRVPFSDCPADDGRDGYGTTSDVSTITSIATTAAAANRSPQELLKKSLVQPKTVSFSEKVTRQDDDGDKLILSSEDSFQQQQPEEPQRVKIMYLTYSFYAPWVHTAHLNTQRAQSFHQRRIAREYGEIYKQKLRAPPPGAIDLDEMGSTSTDSSRPSRRLSIKESSNKIAAMGAFVTGLSLHTH